MANKSFQLFQKTFVDFKCLCHHTFTWQYLILTADYANWLIKENFKHFNDKILLIISLDSLSSLITRYMLFFLPKVSWITNLKLYTVVSISEDKMVIAYPFLFLLLILSTRRISVQFHLFLFVLSIRVCL